MRMGSEEGFAIPKPGRADRKAGVTRRTSPSRAKKWGAEVEREVVKDMNAAGLDAKKVPYSGADKSGNWEEGDVTTSWFLAEIKARDIGAECNAKSINLNWLDKAEEEAAKYGKPAVLVFRRKGSTKKVVVADFDALISLLGKAQRILRD